MWTDEEDDILLEYEWALEKNVGYLLERFRDRTAEQLFARYNELINRRQNRVKVVATKPQDELLLDKIRRHLREDAPYMEFLESLSLYLKGDSSADVFLDKIKELELNEFTSLIAQSIPIRQHQKKISLLTASINRANTKLEVLSAQKSIKELVFKEREGEQIDRATLISKIEIFLKNREPKELELFMLQEACSYYSAKGLSWMKDSTCADYMLKSEECLQKEKERSTLYLQNLKLVEKVQNELLLVVGIQLLKNEHSGCRALLRDDEVDDLSRIYRLYSPIPHGLEPVADLFKQHVTAEGNSLIKQASDAATDDKGSVQDQVLIRKVIELHDKYMVYVNECFQKDNLFHKALKEAFEVFFNKKVTGVSSAEILATYCDNILKKGGGDEKLCDEAIEATLEKVVVLLVYVSDKDLFAEFYRKKLARRLLFDRSGSDEQERSMLSKFKELLGGQFTSKMEGMVTDMTVAKDFQGEFEDYQTTKMTTKLGIDLTVTVLTTGFWPSYKTSDLNLPTEMVNCIEAFKAFYGTKTKHRRLSWLYSLGTCQIVGKFDKKPIELLVSTYQAAVLLLFNNTERLSYTEILEQLNLSKEDLGRVLHSLSCAKYKILIKEPMSRSISHTDSFVLNSKFTDKMRRIKVPLPPMDERKKVVEDVDKDRRYAIDAALVRIMKSRKVLGHQQLVSECVEHLSKMFKPDINMIKKRIEDLINRDYLERDSENTFKYMP